MKKLLGSFWVSFFTIILFGWAMISFYSANIEFARIVNEDVEPPWEVTISATPLFFILLIGAVLIPLSYYYNRKRKKKPWIHTLFMPTELVEDDEREQMITGKACRNSYISMWISFPTALTIFIFAYPFIKETMPYFPIIVILLVPLVQVITFHITLKKQL
ncbi:hypothetical protein [Alkalihalobacterium bogoriense]|uniref:hypothetical protein n=1 Tax=Alkalihalobacterium bogoriense TaxID=246272 RepID=UPI00047A2D96|nr:hypothetical protein [Alkalihalobacterium bogoriense]